MVSHSRRGHHTVATRGVVRLARVLRRTRCPRNGGNTLDEVAAVMTHPSGGSTVRGERRRWRRGGSRRRWAPVSGGIRSGSCSTGEDGKGEARPKLRGKRGRWPSSLRMEDGGGDGGVQWGPEPLSHRRWTGGVEGGGGGGESATLGHGQGGRGEKRGTAAADTFYDGPGARHRGNGEERGASMQRGIAQAADIGPS
jgi:hypothetical protein